MSQHDTGQLQARAGDRDAQYQLAVLHRKGAGVLRSAARAREWYTRAAESGNPKAAQAMQVSRERMAASVGR